MDLGASLSLRRQKAEKKLMTHFNFPEFYSLIIYARNITLCDKVKIKANSKVREIFSLTTF